MAIARTVARDIYRGFLSAWEVAKDEPWIVTALALFVMVALALA